MHYLVEYHQLNNLLDTLYNIIGVIDIFSTNNNI